MKKIWFFLIAFLLSCGVPSSKDVTTVRMYREATATLHADAEFAQPRRDTLLLAAEKIRKFTADRARIDIVFDLDFNSPTSLESHVVLGDSMVRDVEPGSSVAAAIDARHPSTTEIVQAETMIVKPVTLFTPPQANVTFIPARYKPEIALAVAMHEFGHVVGFEHTPGDGNIMSGIGRANDPVLTDFTAGDLVECQRVHLCD